MHNTVEVAQNLEQHTRLTSTGLLKPLESFAVVLEARREPLVVRFLFVFDWNEQTQQTKIVLSGRCLAAVQRRKQSVKQNSINFLQANLLLSIILPNLKDPSD